MLVGRTFGPQNWAVAQIASSLTDIPHDPCPPAFRRRWHELLDALELERLVDDFVERVASVPYYREHVLTAGPEALIEAIARASLGAIISCLDDRIDDGAGRAALEAAATPLGVRRARAGVPTEALVSAIRIDFTVVWSALQAMQRDDADARILVDRTAGLWGVVEAYAAFALESYERERARIELDGDLIVRGHVATLLGSTAVPDEAARLAAAGLQFDPDDRFVVVAVADPFLDRASGHLNDAVARGAHAYLYPRHRSATMVWAEGPATRHLLERFERVPCGMVRHIDGAAEIPAAAKTANLLARLLRRDDESALDADRGWARIARAQLESVGFELARDAHRSMRAIGASERARLRDTIRAYLRTGSVPETARRLHFHRNTVLNHVNRFAEVTGLDVTVPRDAALVLVAGLVDEPDAPGAASMAATA